MAGTQKHTPPDSRKKRALQIHKRETFPSLDRHLPPKSYQAEKQGPQKTKENQEKERQRQVHPSPTRSESQHSSCKQRLLGHSDIGQLEQRQQEDVGIRQE